MEQAGLDLNLKDGKGIYVEEREEKSVQGRETHKDAWWWLMQEGETEWSCHGSSYDFSFLDHVPNWLLSCLSSLELKVSSSNQACQPWILATLLPASVTSSAPTPGQPDTAGESESLASWNPDAWLSFISHFSAAVAGPNHA